MTIATFEVVERTVTYRVHYTYPTCFDWGGVTHDQGFQDTWEKVEAESDKDARLATLDEKYNKKELCYHGRRSRPRFVEKIVHERAANGWERTTTEKLKVPRPKLCPCGKEYWPIRDEKPCHSLVEA